MKEIFFNYVFKSEEIDVYLLALRKLMRGDKSQSVRCFCFMPKCVCVRICDEKLQNRNCINCTNIIKYVQTHEHLQRHVDNASAYFTQP